MLFLGILKETALFRFLSGEKEKIKNENIQPAFQNGESVRNERYLYTEYFDKDGQDDRQDAVRSSS